MDVTSDGCALSSVSPPSIRTITSHADAGYDSDGEIGPFYDAIQYLQDEETEFEDCIELPSPVNQQSIIASIVNFASRKENKSLRII